MGLAMPHPPLSLIDRASPNGDKADGRRMLHLRPCWRHPTRARWGGWLADPGASRQGVQLLHLDRLGFHPDGPRQEWSRASQCAFADLARQEQ